MEELGCTDLIIMDIENSGQPVVSKPCKTPITEKGQID